MIASKLLLILLVAAPSAALAARETPSEPPRLLLFISVDQLRGDMPRRFLHRFGDGGFRYLMKHGVWFTDAHFRHATTMTGAGHATLFTGGNPAEHGIVGNDWWSARAGSRVYCVHDRAHDVLGDVQAHDHSKFPGTSPRNMRGSTIGDELITASGGASRVFSVSVKDRAAILPGGHLGKAFWYAKSTGRFVTSTHYYNRPPAWLVEWNDADHAGRFRDGTWDLLQDRDRYVYRDADDRSFEREHGHLGRVFPHPLGTEDSKAYYRELRYTPMVDELLLDFARTVVRAEQLGRGPATDLLAVSFSATDYIGHAFGPNSLEAEDNVLRLDATVARLLAFIDEQIGLDRTLVVLSADHGVGQCAENRHAMMCDEEALLAAGWQFRGDQPFLDLKTPQGVIPCCGSGKLHINEYREALDEGLAYRTGTRGLIAEYWHPNVYLNHSLIQERGLDRLVVERHVIELMEQMPGVHQVYRKLRLLSGQIRDDQVSSLVRRSIDAERSGDLFVVLKPFWTVHKVPLKDATGHGTAYNYDTHVPILIAGPGIPSLQVDRNVGPEDIAVTLATLLSIPQPSGSVGQVLPEVRPEQ